MCLIIYSRPSTAKISKEELEAAANLNPDGIGVAYSLNNELITKKGFENFEDFYHYYYNIPIEATSLIHLRKSSAGAPIPENLHPFSLVSLEDNNKNELTWCLNGTVAEYVHKDSDKSDCYIMHEVIIKPMFNTDKEFHKKYYIQKLLKSHINLAKMVIMDKFGETIIINESLGVWNEEKTIWLSNINHLEKLNKNKKSSKDNIHNLLSKSTPHSKKLYRYHGKTKYFLENMGSGTPPNLKKKYYLRSDNLYRELSLDEILELSQKHHCGIKKLLKKYIIGKLSHVDPAKIQASEILRYENYWKEKELINGINNQSKKN